MKQLLLTLALLVTPLGLSQPAVSAETNPRGVVELFTSQGCSSCPPADEILAEYAKDGDTLALSWHVDYWNYLGWADTFSSAAATKRQQNYAHSFARRGVYTPQAVVNGRTHTVGSRKGAIEDLLKGGVAPLSARIEVKHSADSVAIACSRTAAGEDATLSIVYFIDSTKVAIERGENEDRTITYRNVVRAMDMVGMVKDGAMETILPLDSLRARAREVGASHAALLLQVPTEAGLAGPIIGAARLGAL
jgi:hypothetical protein